MDRRLAAMLLEGAPADIPGETIKCHLRNKALLHKAEEALLRADLTRVDLEALTRLLRPELSNEVRRFAPGVFDSVCDLGGQFSKALMTTVPGGETLESQHRDRVIKFWDDWLFAQKKQEYLTVAPSVAGQVIYLPDLVEGSLRCSFDEVEEGRKSVEEIIASLPKVQGLRWTVGNMPTVNRVLANHLKETGEYLLPGVYTWTTDEYNSPTVGRCRLVVGVFRSFGVDVLFLPPVGRYGSVGLFVLGVVPE